MDMVLVRDEQSLGLAKLYAGGASGIDQTETSWFIGADPAFLIRTDDAMGASGISFTNYFVLSLVNEGIRWEPFMDQLAESISRLLEARTIDGVVLLAMDDRPSEELSIFEAWRSKHPHLQPVTKVHVPRDVYDAAQVIRQGTLMAAARLHAMILGLGSIPFLAISRTTKTENFLDYTHAVGIEAGASVNSSQLTAMLTSILEDSEALAAQKRILQELKLSARAGIERLLDRSVATSATVQARRVPE